MKRAQLCVLALWLAFTTCGIQAALTDGLMSYHPFNGNANDESGNGYHGQEHGVVLAPDRFGVPDTAYRFDNEDYVELVGSSDLHYSTMTICAWAKDESDPSASDQKMIVAKHQRMSNNGYYLSVHEGEEVYNFYQTGITARAGVIDSEWHFVVGVYSGGVAQLYIDSALVASATSSGMTTNTKNVQFGLVEGAHPWEGLIDDVRIYNRALDPAEITELFLPKAGDFNHDSEVGIPDIDELRDAIRYGIYDPAYDVNGDLSLNEEDLIEFIAALVERTDGGVGTYRGDFNLDGFVDGTDLALFKSGFGSSGLGYASGNANPDEFIDATDLAIFKATFGFSGTPDPDGIINPPAVPAPATLSLLALGGLALLRRRR